MELRTRQTVWGLGMGTARMWGLVSGSEGLSVVLSLVKGQEETCPLLSPKKPPPRNLFHFFHEKEVTSFSWWPLAAAETVLLSQAQG